MCRSDCNSTRNPFRAPELEAGSKAMVSTCIFTPSRESLEKAKNKKANQLVRGNNSSITNGAVFCRASTILTHHTTYSNRFKPGMKKTPNHKRDIEAARSIGTTCTSGSHTRIPGKFPDSPQ